MNRPDFKTCTDDELVSWAEVSWKDDSMAYSLVCGFSDLTDEQKKDAIRKARMAFPKGKCIRICRMMSHDDGEYGYNGLDVVIEIAD